MSYELIYNFFSINSIIDSQFAANNLKPAACLFKLRAFFDASFISGGLCGCCVFSGRVWRERGGAVPDGVSADSVCGGLLRSPQGDAPPAGAGQADTLLPEPE